MRWFIVSLIFISMIVLLGWYSSESLTKRILHNQLPAFGFELRALTLSPPRPSGIKITRLEVRSEYMDIEIEQMDLTPLPGGEFLLAIDKLLVTLGMGGEDGPETLRELWVQVQDLLPLAPRSGQIKELTVCQNGQCESMTLGWSKGIGQFDIHLSVPAQHFMADFRYTDRWQLDWLLDEEHALGKFVIEQSDDSFSFSGQGHFELNLSLESLGFESDGLYGLRGDLTSAVFSIDARVSQEASAVTLLSSLVANGNIIVDTDWSFSAEEGRAYSAGKHEIGFSYGSDTATVSIVEHPLINIEPVEFDAADIQVEGFNECRLELDLSEFEIALIQCEVRKASISARKDDFAARVIVSDLEVRQSDERFDLRGRATLRGLIRDSEVLSGEAGFSLEDNIASIEFGGKNQTAEVWGSAIELIASHDLIDGTGTFDAGFRGELRHLLEPAGEFADAEVVSLLENASGQFSLRSNGQWTLPVAPGLELDFQQLDLQHSTLVSLEKISIEYDGYAAEGGAFDAVISGWPVISGDVTVGVPSISAGIGIESLELGFQIYLEPLNGIATMRGSELGMELLGGSIDSQQYSYDFVTGNGVALLSIDKLELSEILALQRQDFTCSGLVSGSVPVQISAGSLTVDGASVVAESPGGYVRYQPDQTVMTLGAQNEGLAVVLDAMTNFQYHTLAAEVDYSAEGLMTARTNIKGANPKYQGGREVHLNLSVEENIKTLLESLRLGAELAEKVGEKTSSRP